MLFLLETVGLKTPNGCYYFKIQYDHGHYEQNVIIRISS